MRDDLPRRLLKLPPRGLFWVERWWRRALDGRRGRSPYLLGGECRRCGGCCEAPAVRATLPVWFLPPLRRVFLWWQRRVNGFELARLVPEEQVFVFRCTHFDRKTRSCDSYPWRPAMCRDYPRALLAQLLPEFLPSCGHRPVARNAARLLRALESRALRPEQLAKLKRELFLEV